MWAVIQSRVTHRAVPPAVLIIRCFDEDNHLLCVSMHLQLLNLRLSLNYEPDSAPCNMSPGPKKGSKAAKTNPPQLRVCCFLCWCPHSGLYISTLPFSMQRSLNSSCVSGTPGAPTFLIAASVRITTCSGLSRCSQLSLPERWLMIAAVIQVSCFSPLTERGRVY